MEAGKKLSTLKFLLQLKTGMKWKSYDSPVPEGAKAGGSLILISEVVKSVAYNEIIGGGILSELKVKWGNNEDFADSLVMEEGEVVWHLRCRFTHLSHCLVIE